MVGVLNCIVVLVIGDIVRRVEKEIVWIGLDENCIILMWDEVIGIILLEDCFFVSIVVWCVNFNFFF